MCKTVLIAQESGYIYDIDALLVNQSASETGAGRKTKSDKIDYGAGIMLKKRVGDKINKGEIIAKIFAANDEMCQKAKSIMGTWLFKITNEEPDKKKLIYEIVR